VKLTIRLEITPVPVLVLVHGLMGAPSTHTYIAIGVYDKRMSVSVSASASSNLLVFNISQIATGLPYSESPRTIVRSGPILINFRCKLICFRPDQCFDFLGWGSSPLSALKNYTLGGGPFLTVLFVSRAHQPTLRVDLRVEGFLHPTLNPKSAASINTSTSIVFSIIVELPWPRTTHQTRTC
jgi:hypothetical protein